MSGCDNFDFEGPQDEFPFMDGLRGADGTTFYPHVSAEGVLSWTNDGGKPNPAPVNIKGADGKSAYAAAVEAGFTGTEAEFNTYLSGIGDLTQAVADQKSNLDDLTALVDRKAGMLVDTASGSIASFVPDSTIDNLLGVSVAVEPVQDLHGYDNPWPGGGGKNLLKTTLSSGTVNNVQITVNDDGTFALNGNASSYAYLTVGKLNVDASMSYRISPTLGGLSTQYYYRVLEDDFAVWSAERVYTPSQTREVTLQFVFPSNASFSNLLQKPMIRLSTVTDSTFAPYSNECPISGWDAVKVTRTGKNLINSVASGANNGITATKQADNSYSVTGTATGLAINVWIQGNYITNMNQFDALKIMFFKAGTKLTIKDCKAFFTSADGAQKNQTFIRGSYYYIGDSSYTITIPYDCWLTGVRIPDAVIGTAYNTTLYPQIEIGNTSSSYEPYQGDAISITFPSEAGTVYGGALDVENGADVTNNLAVFDGSADEQWRLRESGVSCFSIIIPNADRVWTGQLENGLSNYLVANNEAAYYGREWAFGIDGNSLLLVGAPGIETVADWRSYLSQHPLQIWYTLKSPVHIDTDPMTIATIANQTNSVWADAGDVSVEFAADLKHYIDSKIAAAVAALS